MDVGTGVCVGVAVTITTVTVDVGVIGIGVSSDEQAIESPNNNAPAITSVFIANLPRSMPIRYHYIPTQSRSRCDGTTYHTIDNFLVVSFILVRPRSL